MTHASDLVLIADDDADIVRFVEVNLRLEGYDVATARDGDQALDQVLRLAPDLVLLDVMMPLMDGYQVCTKMRADDRSAHIPVIMLTAKSLPTDKVLGLSAGADDYIVKPFDPLELVARVRTVLRRSSEMRSLSPLTGLPGNTRIEEELERRVGAGGPLAVVYADLDRFKSFNDRYGFLRGDEVIGLAASVLREGAHEIDGKTAFVGHVGGDDFVVLLEPDAVDRFAAHVLACFDQRIVHYYDPRDAAAGGIETLDRQGRPAWSPLVSISLGIASTEGGAVTSYHELVAIATEVKRVAKQQDGSSVAIDRRRRP